MAVSNVVTRCNSALTGHEVGRQENPVLVLFDLRGHFEEREDHGGGLGRGQGRVSERVGAERMMQDIGPARPGAAWRWRGRLWPTCDRCGGHS